MSSNSDNEIKTEDPGFVKDSYSSALLSVDTAARDEVLIRRKQIQRSQSTENDINSMKREIDHLKSDVGEIKGLITQLLDKIS